MSNQFSTTSFAAFNAGVFELNIVWSASIQNNTLLVAVRFGGQSDATNTLEINIPVGNSEQHSIEGKNPKISFTGNVTALWGNNNQSYLVIFSGTVAYPPFVEILPLPNSLASNSSIIVAANIIG